MVQFQYVVSFLQTRLGMVYHNASSFSSIHKVVVLESNMLRGFVFSTYLRLKGYEVIYIRVSLAEDSISLAVEQIRPKYVVISFDDGRELKNAMNYVNVLQEKMRTFLLGL